MLEKQVRWLVLDTLRKAYPDGMSIMWIESVLFAWRIFISRKELYEKVIKWLVDKGYVEIVDVELPVHMDRVQKLRITIRGMHLLSGQLVDNGVEKIE